MFTHSSIFTSVSVSLDGRLFSTYKAWKSLKVNIEKIFGTPDIIDEDLELHLMMCNFPESRCKQNSYVPFCLIRKRRRVFNMLLGELEAFRAINFY